MSDSDESKSESAPTETKTPPRRRGVLRYVIIAVVLVVGGIFGTREVHQRLNYVYEYDARIAGTLITVSSRDAGWVTSMPVKEGDQIKKDGLLVTIDDRESKLLAKQLEAQIDGVKAQRARLVAERKLVDVQTESKIRTQLSSVSAAAAAVSALEPQLKLAEIDFKRDEELVNKRVIPRRQFDQTRTNMQRIDGEYRMAVAELEESRSMLHEARADRQRLEVLDTEIGILEHETEELAAQLARQKLDLEDRTIGMPIGGVVDRTFVEIGEYVTPGQRLLLVHDPRNVWIDANVKETDIRELKIGQTVNVTVDAYPDRSFAGKVFAIGNAATSEFALLPTPNPSGNFTKITQRLRVRIAIEQEEQILRPGMMVEVFIDVR